MRSLGELDAALREVRTLRLAAVDADYIFGMVQNNLRLVRLARGGQGLLDGARGAGVSSSRQQRLPDHRILLCSVCGRT